MQILIIDYVGRTVGVNKKYCNRSYVLTKEYRNFKNILAKEAKLRYNGEVIKGAVSLLIEIKTSKDIDAVIKPVLDAIQDAGVYKNDNQIKNFEIKKQKIKKNIAEELKVWVSFNDL